jgi:hypothetical protein
MKDFEFIFDGPPSSPHATSPLDEVFGWAVWRAMELGLKDVVVDESEQGLLVGCLDYARRGKNRGPKYVPLVTLPHLRGSPLKKLPVKALGIAACGQERWNVRLWTCQRLAGETFRLCAIVQLVPQVAR